MRIVVIVAVALAAASPCAERGGGEPAKLPQEQFVGEWVAFKAKSPGWTRLKVSQDGGNWSVEAWAAYGEGDKLEAATGKAQLHLLGDQVTDSALPYGFAVREESFGTTYLTVRIEKGELAVERYTVITDGSGRSSYRIVQTFKRK